MKKALATAFAAISFSLIAAFALPGQALASGGESSDPSRPDHGEVVCPALDHCPELPPPDRCDAAGNCEYPPDPGCYEGPDGDCLPPWCDPSRPISDCPVEPPHPEPPLPPFCEDGSEVCVPPMPPWCEEVTNGFETSYQCERPLPPWCDEAGNCEPPKCDPAEGNPKFCRPFPDDPVVCVMGWPVDGPMPDCPGDYPPPFCGDDEITPLPAPQARIKFPGREELCWPPPPLCDPTEPGTTDPGESREGSGSEPGFEGETESGEFRSDEVPAEDGDEKVEDPLPCVYPPPYGCFEDETGQTLCVDPPVSDCWEVEGKPGLIACPIAEPEGKPEQKGGKGKAAKAKARAKARARARAAKARAKAKAKKVKAAKAKAKKVKAGDAKAKAKAKARR